MSSLSLHPCIMSPNIFFFVIIRYSRNYLKYSKCPKDRKRPIRLILIVLSTMLIFQKFFVYADMGSGELGRCGRRPCSGRAPGFLYPEFQHRPPPPSYQASMQEYRLR